MVKIEDGKICEFIEILYGQLNERDGGYYSDKHDKEVFETASIKFNIPISELNRIYNEFGEIAGNLTVENLNKLPKDSRKKRTEEYLINILKNNKDLSFYEIEGAPSKPVKSGILIINENYKKLAETIGENGWTIPMAMGLKKFEELYNLNKDVDNNGYDSFFLKYYNKNNFKSMKKHINASSITSTQKQSFNECIDAYNRGHYLVCITTLITVLEGVLSVYNTNKSNIQMMSLCRKNMDSTEHEGKLIGHLIWVSFYSFITQLYKKSDFNNNEPTSINRHWLLHGRSETEWTSSDCLRVFNAIYTLISIRKYENI